MVDREEIVNALHTVEDPELGMDIVELGLFYDAEIAGPKVKVIHTLTSMGCPAGPMIQEDIHNATAAVEGKRDACRSSQLHHLFSMGYLSRSASAVEHYSAVAEPRYGAVNGGSLRSERAQDAAGLVALCE